MKEEKWEYISENLKSRWLKIVIFTHINKI